MKLANYQIKRSCLMSLLVAGLAIPMVSYGQDNSSQQTPSASNQNQQTDAKSNQQNQNNQQVDLSNYSNGSFVSLRGTVESVSPNTFTLSYNDNEKVTVEMDDGDNDADAYALLPGDKVTVTGLLDRDLFEARKIEAGSVYVEKLNTYFMSSALDEEDYPMFTTIVAIEPASDSGSDSSRSSSDSSSAGSSPNASTAASENMPVVWLQGKVSSVSNDSLKIAMDEAGNNEITVSTENLSSNPLDNSGGRKIETGDIVQVSGQLDESFFDTQEMVANSISKIHDKQNVN